MHAYIADMEAARREAPADIVEWPELDGHHGMIRVLNVPLGVPRYVHVYMRGKAEELHEEVHTSKNKLLSTKPNRRAKYCFRNCILFGVEAFAEAADATHCLTAAAWVVAGVSSDPSTYGIDTNPMVTDFIAGLFHDAWDPAAEAEAPALSEDALVRVRIMLHLSTRLKLQRNFFCPPVCMTTSPTILVDKASNAAAVGEAWGRPHAATAGHHHADVRVMEREDAAASGSHKKLTAFLDHANNSASGGHSSGQWSKYRTDLNVWPARRGVARTCMWTVAIPTVMTPQELREVEMEMEMDDLFHHAMPLRDTVPWDGLKDMVPDSELSLLAFNVVTESCDSRSLKPTLLEYETMIMRLCVRDAVWHNTESEQKGLLRDILDVSEYTRMVFGTVG
eukprot:jgi/Tetstr1/427663/TSEL_017788.t1